jgi:phosphoribosyl 1,2-cyclic phosphate phosphodiesterase
MAEAIVLGSGTSNGVPMLGARYAPEFLANPKNHRTRSSLLLRGPKGNLLIDCAPEMRLQLTREGIYDVEAVLVSHTHADHIMGMDDLRSLCIRDDRDMPVYTLPRYQEDIRRVFAYAFQQFPEGIFVPRFDLRDLPEELEVGGMRVQTFLVMHGEVPVVGVRVNDFAYLTDVNEIPPASWERLQGLDTLVMDAVRRRPHPTHFHLERSIEVAQALAPRQTYFTHLSADYDHDVDNAKLPAGINLAFDGLRIEV